MLKTHVPVRSQLEIGSMVIIKSALDTYRCYALVIGISIGIAGFQFPMWLTMCEYLSLKSLRKFWKPFRSMQRVPFQSTTGCRHCEPSSGAGEAWKSDSCIQLIDWYWCRWTEWESVLSSSKPENCQSTHQCPLSTYGHHHRCCCFSLVLHSERAAAREGLVSDVLCFYAESCGNKHILYSYWGARCMPGPSGTSWLPENIWFTNNMNNNNKAVKSSFVLTFGRFVYTVHHARILKRAP